MSQEGRIFLRCPALLHMSQLEEKTETFLFSIQGSGITSVGFSKVDTIGQDIYVTSSGSEFAISKWSSSSQKSRGKERQIETSLGNSPWIGFTRDQRFESQEEIFFGLTQLGSLYCFSNRRPESRGKEKEEEGEEAEIVEEHTMHKKHHIPLDPKEDKKRFKITKQNS